MKKFILLIVLMMLVVGCSDSTPKPRPRFQNFDVVKVTLRGSKAQIVNNRLEYDRTRGCWLVQIKMEKQSVADRMARKLLDKADIKSGMLTQTLFEAELEPWVDE